jgi:hypothetical protein
VTTSLLRFIRLFRILAKTEKSAPALRSGAGGPNSLEPGEGRAPLGWLFEKKGLDYDEM